MGGDGEKGGRIQSGRSREASRFPRRSTLCGAELKGEGGDKEPGSGIKQETVAAKGIVPRSSGREEVLQVCGGWVCGGCEHMQGARTHCQGRSREHTPRFALGRTPTTKYAKGDITGTALWCVCVWRWKACLGLLDCLLCGEGECGGRASQHTLAPPTRALGPPAMLPHCGVDDLRGRHGIWSRVWTGPHPRSGCPLKQVQGPGLRRVGQLLTSSTAPGSRGAGP